ncbi:MAG: hypothetical protein J2P22_02455 [Nocardioides sp.]|nr:hypothetical protein [Nocardioides sp.]
MVTVPDGTSLRLLVDDEAVSMTSAEVCVYVRMLNMADGTLSRRAALQLSEAANQDRLAPLRFVYASAPGMHPLRPDHPARDKGPDRGGLAA